MIIDHITKLLLASIVVLLALNVFISLGGSGTAYGQRGVEYLVVDKRTRDLKLTPAQDFEVFLNRYGREGWKLVSFRGPDNSVVFVR